jgi:hypothetical protein
MFKLIICALLCFDNSEDNLCACGSQKLEIRKAFFHESFSTTNMKKTMTLLLGTNCNGLSFNFATPWSGI